MENDSGYKDFTSKPHEVAVCRNCGNTMAATGLVEGCCLACVQGAFSDLLTEEEQNVEARKIATKQHCYTVGKEIGKGGMGKVYLGRREADGELVAIKFIHSELSKDEALRRRFAAESAALARLEHPNIVAHLDAGETEDGGTMQPFLVMDYVAGSDLGVALRRMAKAGEPFAFEVILQDGLSITCGLAAAHAEGLIHRDLKPANGPPPIQHENSLGMKFRPIPRHEALLCIWETRVQDYKAHAADTPKDGEPQWMKDTGYTYPSFGAFISLGTDGWKARQGASWRSPGWEIRDDLPVAGPCFNDAAGFCTWLTWKERREKKSQRISVTDCLRMKNGVPLLACQLKRGRRRENAKLQSPRHTIGSGERIFLPLAARQTMAGRS